MRGEFKDHFSKQAAQYKRSRPQYPSVLIDYVVEKSAAHDLAWDCATGNGQVAVALADRFSRVIASDASASQIGQCEIVQGIEYRIAAAEDSGLESGSVNLVTVAQALHWFNQPAFFAEVERVLAPGGIFAVWCYGLASINPEIDQLVARFYGDTVGPYWPSERTQIESGYEDIRFPWPVTDTPAFSMLLDWSLDDCCGFLSSWSAVQRYKDDLGVDPVAEFRSQLALVWGSDARRVNWPLITRVFAPVG